jgi:serine/threonine protein kinase
MLKTHLIEMHRLGFLHRDIKPNNIMHSNAYHKFVFIDFGISEFRKEKPGDLIKTHFKGTYSFCTEEMKKLFNIK